MNGLLFHPQPTLTPRGRMTFVLDAVRYLLSLKNAGAGDCEACLTALTDRCPEHARSLADEETVNDGIDAVESAPGEDTATAAGLRAILTVLGISEADAVRALSAATPGGDAGTKN